MNYSRMFDLMVQYPKSKEGFNFGGFLSHMLVFGVESNQAEEPASLRRSCCNLSRCLLEQVKLVLEQVFPGEEEGFCVVAAVVFSFCIGHLCPRWLPRSSSFLGCCVVGLCTGCCAVGRPVVQANKCHRLLQYHCSDRGVLSQRDLKSQSKPAR